MNDLTHASTLFLIFALVLIAYGALLEKTGKVDYLPLSVRHSVGGSADVRRIGIIVCRIALIVGLLASILIALTTLGLVDA